MKARVADCVGVVAEHQIVAASMKPWLKARVGELRPRQPQLLPGIKLQRKPWLKTQGRGESVAQL